jgi:hypothetical protein
MMHANYDREEDQLKSQMQEKQGEGGKRFENETRVLGRSVLANISTIEQRTQLNAPIM